MNSYLEIIRESVQTARIEHLREQIQSEAGKQELISKFKEQLAQAWEGYYDGDTSGAAGESSQYATSEFSGEFEDQLSNWKLLRDYMYRLN